MRRCSIVMAILLFGPLIVVVMLLALVMLLRGCP